MTSAKEPTPWLSIIIPSFNCAAYLSRSVASAFAFIDRPVEVLVVDDGSTDETADLCAALVRQHPRLQVLRKENGGLSSARNHGIDHATGRFVLFLDADDELIAANDLPELTASVEVLRVGVEEVTVGGATAVHAEPALAMSGPEALARSFAQHHFYPPSWAYIYRLDWLRAQRLRFGHGLIHEDMLFTVQALMACTAYAATPRLVYRYFRRPGSITTEIDDAKLVRRVASLAEICRQLTVLANQRPDVDLGWWILYTMNYAAQVAQLTRGRMAKWLVLRMEVRFMLGYRLWGQFRTRRDVRYRLRLRAQAWLQRAGPARAVLG